MVGMKKHFVSGQHVRVISRGWPALVVDALQDDLGRILILSAGDEYRWDAADLESVCRKCGGSGGIGQEVSPVGLSVLTVCDCPAGRQALAEWTRSGHTVRPGVDLEVANG
jgi:hypothetical protein